MTDEQTETTGAEVPKYRALEKLFIKTVGSNGAHEVRVDEEYESREPPPMPALPLNEPAKRAKAASIGPDWVRIPTLGKVDRLARACGFTDSEASTGVDARISIQKFLDQYGKKENPDDKPRE